MSHAPDTWTKAEINTKFGKVTLVFTDKDHVHVCNDVLNGASHERHTLTIRGKELNRLSMHLHRKEGDWFDLKHTVGDRVLWGRTESGPNGYVIATGIHAGGFNKDATQPQKEVLYGEILPLVENWVKKNPDAFQAMNKAQRKLDALALRKRITEAETNLETLRAELATLEAE